MGAKKVGKRRFCSDEEKRLICMQTRVPNVSVAQVARRYAMNASLASGSIDFLPAACFTVRKPSGDHV